MNNKEKKDFLTKVKILISTGLLCTSLNTKANFKKAPVIVIGNPKYSKELIYEFYHTPYKISRFIQDNDIDIYLLPTENSAEYYWKKDGDRVSGKIRGFTRVKKTKEKTERDIFVEACMRYGYYENHSDSSKGTTKEEFYYRMCKNTLMHELGHAIDGTQDFFLSKNNVFKQIYKEEINKFRETEQYKVENLKVEANINTSTEYFATAFSAFICHPKDLLEKCPLTYWYIERYLKKIEAKYLDKDELIEKYNNINNSYTKNKQLTKTRY